jgi:hypothetical protein
MIIFFTTFICIIIRVFLIIRAQCLGLYNFFDELSYSIYVSLNIYQLKRSNFVFYKQNI